ncbi:lactosylceramide 1,3-N-acetyl-beta-D-glucosaminyltransferase A [Alosa sapidissima]|uniref:lactosylceramide 1,3-N-acetyl-beta-D-glucosaminyltransferase A n=1 Tax=Alosa sapidissima TaxID=34773 RepID=UPI001C098C16|nr:lactosylceramide 1,3-N-acetyl-beta-D-glucosaminyltransferase A [Alosa sapidissima]XP_041967431.1 lactosylceramide 1,3-N-acetyl-beta-D-glucosaminyltransferase A [Alosa sapidissima]XP_041967432.1 lactosylceramide 1,3-N-acetyl-beta-D-glucosaminyltransferase A [Alosa sapidissima]XP_041967433.1 lactosylceramide 1,3-N-acetyl-beta-D-glucosaminyltransferase A [Alosa sapidissima]
MFMNFRRIRKCQCLQLISMCFVLSVLMVCWEQLDHHVVRHMKSYSYRYLVNSYDFINKSFSVSGEEAESFCSFPYLLDHKEMCNGKDVLLLLFVKSSPENVERRQAIRSTWGNESYIQEGLGVTVKVVFALGVHPNTHQRASVQQALSEEDRTYKDLVQQDFEDTFHNLTIKLLLQFRWAHAHCAHASFLMSADDDIFIHMPNLVRYLQGLKEDGVQDFWAGHVHRGAPPIRRRDSKYYMPYEMYQWPSYPDYTAGAGYVVSGDVAAKIYQASTSLNASLYIDDVFMGICAKSMGVSPQEHVYFSGEGKAPYHPCIYEKMITSHGHVADVRHLWKMATDPKINGISSGIMGKLYCTAVKMMLLCKPYYVNTYPCKAAFL